VLALKILPSCVFAYALYLHRRGDEEAGLSALLIVHVSISFVALAAASYCIIVKGGQPDRSVSSFFCFLVLYCCCGRYHHDPAIRVASRALEQMRLVVAGWQLTTIGPLHLKKNRKKVLEVLSFRGPTTKLHEFFGPEPEHRLFFILFFNFRDTVFFCREHSAPSVPTSSNSNSPQHGGSWQASIHIDRQFSAARRQAQNDVDYGNGRPLQESYLKKPNSHVAVWGDITQPELVLADKIGGGVDLAIHIRVGKKEGTYGGRSTTGGPLISQFAATNNNNHTKQPPPPQTNSRHEVLRHSHRMHCRDWSRPVS
jgi:hypothetical protein